MNRFARLGIVALAGAVGSGCVVSVDSQGQIVREEKRFEMDGPPELHLKTFDGAIEIQSWERPDVLVEVEKRGATKETVDTIEVVSSQNGRRIELEAKRPRSETLRGFGFHLSSSAKLRVSIPRRSDIVARTGDGSIHLAGVNGRVELRTGDGSIRVSDVAGDLDLNTGDGSVTVDRAEGRLSVDTGDGGVDVSGKLSAVRMHTGDGSIVYRLDAGAAMSDDWDISTGDGSVALYLPSSFSAELDAHTGDGTVRSDLQVSNATSRESNRRAVRGTIGDGGRRLRVRTGDGSISLKLR
jgi:DUF4097 and DUF4098 domain-containing protein YvlB